MNSDELLARKIKSKEKEKNFTKGGKEMGKTDWIGGAILIAIGLFFEIPLIIAISNPFRTLNMGEVIMTLIGIILIIAGILVIVKTK